MVWHRWAGGFVGLVLAAALDSAAEPPRAPRQVVRGLMPLLVGNPGDVQRPTRPALVLAGGGADVDVAMRFFGERAGAGDLVVLRASGGGGYNQYLLDLTGADSVETFVVASRRRAEDPYVLARVSQAEGVVVAGGDQADYVNFWGGTPLARAIDNVVARGAPLFNRQDLRHVGSAISDITANTDGIPTETAPEARPGGRLRCTTIVRWWRFPV